MLNAIKKLFGIKPAETSTPVEVAPYKVPEPAATTSIPLVQLGPEPTLLPAGTEASVAAPVAVAKPAKVVKPKAPAKSKVEKAPKKPRAPKAK
jgi:hypothetical protein